jgi:hypothetical protein
MLHDSHTIRRSLALTCSVARSPFHRFGLQGLALVLALPAAVGMANLLSFHIRMVLTNRTTIEWREGVTAQINAGAMAPGRRHGEHPYDIGACRQHAWGRTMGGCEVPLAQAWPQP